MLAWTQIHRLIQVSFVKLADSGGFLIISKVLEATPPFDFAQGHEPVEWQMMPRWWIRVGPGRTYGISHPRDLR